jgi:hypothetical protein
MKTWLIRRLLGADKIEDHIKLARIDTYEKILSFVAERLAKDSERYTNEFYAQKFVDFKPDFLANVIQVNKNIDDTQKAAIVDILNSQPAIKGVYG